MYSLLYAYFIYSNLPNLTLPTPDISITAMVSFLNSTNNHSFLDAEYELNAIVEKLTPVQYEALHKLRLIKKLPNGKPATEKQTIMQFARWHMQNPDVYSLAQKLFDKLSDSFKAGNKTREFLKFVSF
jgi:hypothetical protein